MMEVPQKRSSRDGASASPVSLEQGSELIGFLDDRPVTCVGMAMKRRTGRGAEALCRPDWHEWIIVAPEHHAAIRRWWRSSSALRYIIAERYNRRIDLRGQVARFMLGEGGRRTWAFECFGETASGGKAMASSPG